MVLKSCARLLDIWVCLHKHTDTKRVFTSLLSCKQFVQILKSRRVQRLTECRVSVDHLHRCRVVGRWQLTHSQRNKIATEALVNMSAEFCNCLRAIVGGPWLHDSRRLLLRPHCVLWWCMHSFLS